MIYDEIISIYYAGKNFTVPKHDLMLARGPGGFYALYWLEGKEVAFGRPALKRAGAYLIFIRCEYCGNKYLDDNERCSGCGKEP